MREPLHLHSLDGLTSVTQPRARAGHFLQVGDNPLERGWVNKIFDGFAATAQKGEYDSTRNLLLL
jgi:hypothetical protein